MNDALDFIKQLESGKLTSETRRESHFKTNKVKLYEAIKTALSGKELTGREVAKELYKKNILPFPARGIIQPRLTELVQDGVLVVVGKKYDKETERKVAVYALVVNGES